MSHDHLGRVGLPRCQECNSPLSSDDRRPRAAETLLCLDCQRDLGWLMILRRKKRGRRRLMPAELTR